MKAVMYFVFMILFMHTIFAEDTGDTGFFDTADSGALTESDYESLTSEDIEELIDYVDDITLLNEYELNKYVASIYGNSLIIEDAVSGATLTSEGFLTNGEGGSQINLNDIPEGTWVALEQDGSITLYTSSEYGFALDLSAVIQTQGPPVTIISTDGNTYFADGSVLFDNSCLIVYENNVFVVDNGVMEYNGVEIRSTTGAVAVIEEDEESNVQAMLDLVSEEYAGTVILGSSRVAVSNEVQVVVRESEEYGIGRGQGLILSSHSNGAIIYENTPAGAELEMYGHSVVFNGLRLLQQNAQGLFYSFKGSGGISNEYTTYLIEQYGYAPTQKDMVVSVYDTLQSQSPEEQYTLTSSVLTDALLTTEEAVEARVAEYFMDPAFDEIPKKKAVLLWSSKSDDRSTFQTVVARKKQGLIEQGYAPEDIQVLHFTTNDEFFRQLDTVSDATYLEVVSHGWSVDSGSMIGTEDYYEHEAEGYREQRKRAVSSQEVIAYLNQRKQNALSGQQEPLAAQEGAFCTISTCHSAASYSVYIPQAEQLIPVLEEKATIAKAFTELGINVHVYGTIGPLWLVGYENEQGTWVKDLVPVSDMTAIFEGQNPETSSILTQDIEYLRLQ